MSHEHEVAAEVKKELRRRGFKRFVVRVGLVVGLVLGGLSGAAVPTRSTYTEALHRQAEVERYAANAILDTHTSVLSYLEGGKETTFLNDERVEARTKELYRDLRRRAAELDAEVGALADGARSLPASIVTHPGLAIRAGVDGLGRPDLMHTQVYKQAGVGALVGGLLGMALGAVVMRRRGHRR